LLLEFMGALECGLYVAHSGSSFRARIPDEAATFFIQNRKVGTLDKHDAACLAMNAVAGNDRRHMILDEQVSDTLKPQWLLFGVVYIEAAEE
jgi:hypothetical protein